MHHVAAHKKKKPTALKVPRIWKQQNQIQNIRINLLNTVKATKRFLLLPFRLL